MPKFFTPLRIISKRTIKVIDKLYIIKLFINNITISDNH